jgi:hypothetical protein
MMDEIDLYLADTMRSDDLSDENVLAALMSLGQTEVIFSVLGMLESDQIVELIDTMGGTEAIVQDAVSTTGSAGPVGGAWAGTPDTGDPWDFQEPGGSWLTPSWPDSNKVTVYGEEYSTQAWPEGLTKAQAEQHIQRQLAAGLEWEWMSQTWKRADQALQPRS